MKIKTSIQKTLSVSPCTFLLMNIFSISAFSQTQRVPGNETAVCTITIGNKTYTPKLNEGGRFNRIYHIPAGAAIPVEIFYPGGTAGEKLIFAAEDGGSFDNGKAVQVIELSSEKKINIIFHVTNDEGLFRITVRKGNDIKTIQLWAGNDPSVKKQKPD